MAMSALPSPSKSPGPGLRPSSIRANTWPAIVTAAFRGNLVGFGATTIPPAPLPEPAEGGMNVTHGTFDDTVQPHPPGAVTVATSELPPLNTVVTGKFTP